MGDIVTAQYIRAAARGPIGKSSESNMISMLTAVHDYGPQLGLDRAHRLVQFYAQIMHESGGFLFDREKWGPTAAQKGYEGRKNLGNTEKGDGKKFAGHGPIQVTGRANTKEFYDWCKSTIGGAVPDFVASPDLINTDPWEGLSALWYWDTRNLNRWADQGDIETITKKINGGTNGFDDRVDYYARLALVVLGLPANGIKQFQASKGLATDGDVGPKTRSALHQELVALTPGEGAKPEVKAAPVVEEKAVVPVAVERQVKRQTTNASWLVGVGGTLGTAMTAALGSNWQTILAVGGLVLVALLVVFLLRRQIVAAVKEIRSGVEQ